MVLPHGMFTWQRLASFWTLLESVRSLQTGILEPFIEKARSRIASGSGETPCAAHAKDSLNFFLIRLGTDSALGAFGFAAIESVLFNHPLAQVFILTAASKDESFDAYLQEGYCVMRVPLDFDILRNAITSLVPGLDWNRLFTMVQQAGAVPFLLNCALLAMQIIYGGVSLSMDGLLLNPFDMMLPRPLTLQNTAVFLEKVLADEETVVPSEVLEREDFDRSWAPRSHTDRADGRTLLCGDYMCPRSLPPGNPFAKLVLEAWLQDFFNTGQTPHLDLAVSRVFKEYIRNRPMNSHALDGHAFLNVPGWIIVEPHFPDNWRYYGNRGKDAEEDDRVHFHSQLFTPRAHRERSDWWLVRSLKLWLPLDYGPPAARNVMPRSAVDLARRLLALRIAPYDFGPLRFSALSSRAGEASHALRTVLDVYEALDNSMAESLGVGQRLPTPTEVALPGAMGGFRTFRDIRIVGHSTCPNTLPTRVNVVMRILHHDVTFSCRSASSPEAATFVAGAIQNAAQRSCERGLKGSSFEVSGTPALVNAAISLLAFRAVPGLGRAPPRSETTAEGPGPDPEQRLSSEELEAHFTRLKIELTVLPCTSLQPQVPSPVASVELRAMLDDVQDQVTVVAHSHERCELLDRLGASFRVLYDRMPVIVTCECPEPEAHRCLEPVRRQHPTIPSMDVIDVPYDFGLSRGKRLLAQHVDTEFILVLDDDFVRSPLSCIECMVWHMRSQLHSIPLPFDMLGFPILEDERNFGAFRGQLRATGGRLFLEPMVSEAALDGCVRVGIHPMAFLARTARFRNFKFQDQLRVGEHEQFFYSNRYLGLQAAVCFDSVFPHFRVQMTAKYKKRRDRMQDLMTQEFQKIGFPSMMYLLHKYDALSGRDHDEFISQDVPPWMISDDTCGPQPNPPTDFVMFFVLIFSSADERGRQFRQLLRGEDDVPSTAWLPRLSAVTSIRRAFFIEESAGVPPDLMHEEEEFGDLVFMPSGSKTGKGGVSATQLRFAFSFLRDFQFRWLIVAQQDTFVLLESLYQSLAKLDPPMRTALGDWQDGLRLQPQFFALTRDVHALLASHRVARWLRTDFGVNVDAATAGLGAEAGQALNAWLSPLSINRANLAGVHVARNPDHCPADCSVLHPVSPVELVVLSDAVVEGRMPCIGLNESASLLR